MSNRCEFWVSHWTNSRGQVLRFHTKLLMASSFIPRIGMEYNHVHTAYTNSTLSTTTLAGCIGMGYWSIIL